MPQAMTALRDKASLVRESLQKSQTITESMVSILGSFDHRLSSLETAMRPTQVSSLYFLQLPQPLSSFSIFCLMEELSDLLLLLLLRELLGFHSEY